MTVIKPQKTAVLRRGYKKKVSNKVVLLSWFYGTYIILEEALNYKSCLESFVLESFLFATDFSKWISKYKKKKLAAINTDMFALPCKKYSDAHFLGFQFLPQEQDRNLTNSLGEKYHFYKKIHRGWSPKVWPRVERILYWAVGAQ